ncbi:hypothetical protein AF335_20050 [Streptomyces eurocidicus]|uniref:Uncharacterized protein n=1 Tax=Streptomyces eurocidicus TaxID=66423 RepID=A0A2N8NTF2_STREU|nr:hypothetical protein [Streptomyces eurocidicus]MBB5121002.1 hypothetical protein [Streptomyces eurocidicus]MBF6055727.1 hypothetical protein [Streptomyces eurocidicus]PNE32046.1 hypothetical protein AF335_20050 [Streptomyces eurocidicus]
MAMDLAIGLAALAARTVVVQLIQGQSMSDAAWAGVAGQVVDVIAGSAARQDSGLQRIQERMAAGRRYVRDFPDSWRSGKDREHLTRDARREFVHAYGIAEQMGSPVRQALADVAIAGCWLWVPSLRDVRKTVGAARQVLEDEILYGSSLPTTSYRDVIRLCKAYGEEPAITADPLIPRWTRPPAPGARLAVRAKYGHWVSCARVDVRAESLPAGGAVSGTRTASGLMIPDSRASATLGKRIRVHIRNRRPDWLTVFASHLAVYAELPDAANTLPEGDRVRPYESTTLDLYRQPFAAVGGAETLSVPSAPRFGFVLPSIRPTRPAAPRTTARQSPSDWLRELFGR